MKESGVHEKQTGTMSHAMLYDGKPHRTPLRQENVRRECEGLYKGSEVCMHGWKRGSSRRVSVKGVGEYRRVVN